MGSEQAFLLVSQEEELSQPATAQIPTSVVYPTDPLSTSHLDTIRSKRLQYFSKTQRVQNSSQHISSPSYQSTASREGRPVSLGDEPVSFEPAHGEADLDLLLLQDSSVPEHRKLRHVLAWAQNFIRTGSAIGSGEEERTEDHLCSALKSVHVTQASTVHASPKNIGHVIKSSHATLTNRNEFPTRQVLQSPQANFSSHPLSHSQPQPSPQPSPLFQPSPLSLSQPQPGLSVYDTYLMCVARLSKSETQGCKEPQLSSRETQGCKEPQLSSSQVQGCKEPQLSSSLTQGCKELHLSNSLTQGCKEPQLSSSKTQDCKGPQLSSSETQDCKELQLSSRETQGCKEPQLSSSQVQGCKEPQLSSSLTQGCKELHLSNSLTQGCKEPQLSSSKTQDCKRPQLSSSETQDCKELQLSSRETQGCKEPQLSSSQVQGCKEPQLSSSLTQGCKELLLSNSLTQGCKEPQLSSSKTQDCKGPQLSSRETHGCKEPQLSTGGVREETCSPRWQRLDTSGNSCMNHAPVADDLNGSLNCESVVGRKDMSDCANPSHSPVENMAEILHNTEAPVDHAIAGGCVTAEGPVPGPAGCVSAEGPVGEDCSGEQDSLRGPDDGARRATVTGSESEEQTAAGSRPRRTASSASSGRRRFWEKSSLLWSSYPQGTLLPRLKSSSRTATTSHTPPLDPALGPGSSRQRARPPAAPQLHGTGDTVLMPWLSLPDELWMAILKLLPPGELSHIAQTCHRLCGLANDRTLWEVVKIENSACLDADCLSSIGRHGPRSLTLYRCTDARVTPLGLEELFAQSKGSLRELRIMSCSGSGLHGDRLLLPCSRHCPHLTDVDMSWTGATDTGLTALASTTTSLESVLVNGCRITDRAFKVLIKRHGGSLCRLEVFGCRGLSAACLSAMATSCPNLKVLNIGKLPKVTEACLTHITTRLKRLTSLNLTGLHVVRDWIIHLIARQCPELRCLTLCCCPHITDRSLTEISTYSATVRYLDVSGCSAVTDLGIQAIAMACHHLQYLDLSSTKTSNKGVCLLASYCSRHLHTVKLSFCYICQDSLLKLCRYCKGLRLLHLYGACDFHNTQQLRLLNRSLEAKCDLACKTSPGQPR